MRSQSEICVYGLRVQQDTRCIHWHSDLDIIAILFKCCDRFYACHSCHEACEDHSAIAWTIPDYPKKAVLCGKCNSLLTISEYLSCNSHCPSCQAPFNPNCKQHWDLYFQRMKF